MKRIIKNTNKLRRHLTAQMGMAKSDFSQMLRSRSGFDYECGAFCSDWSRFEKECNQQWQQTGI